LSPGEVSRAKDVRLMIDAYFYAVSGDLPMKKDLNVKLLETYIDVIQGWPKPGLILGVMK
jgi:hypothetical protein